MQFSDPASKRSVALFLAGKSSCWIVQGLCFSNWATSLQFMCQLTILIKIRTFIHSIPIVHQSKACNACQKSNPQKQWWVRNMIVSSKEKSGQAVLTPSEHTGARIYRHIQGQGHLAWWRKQRMWTQKILKLFYTVWSFLKIFCENSSLCTCIYISFLKVLISEATVFVI